MSTARLPAADRARVPQRKITSYLLAGEHPAGRAKAAFFGRFGFGAQNWERLREALLEHAQSAEVVAVHQTAFGLKYVVEGALAAADDRKPQVRTI